MKTKKKADEALPEPGGDGGGAKSGPVKSGPGPARPGQALIEILRGKRRAWIWGAVLLFMAVGLWFRLSVTLWTPIIYPDSMQYMHLAREIRSGAYFQKDYPLDGGFIKSRRLPPLYSFLMAPFAGTQADLEKVGIVISLGASILVFIPFFLAARRAFGLAAALAGMALLSFHGFTAWFAYPILSESTFTFLYIAVLAAGLWAFSRGSVGDLAKAGLICGALSSLLYLCRDVGITAAPLIAVGAVVKLRWLDRRPWSFALVLAGATLGAFLLVSTPYFIHIRVRTGSWGLTGQMDNTSVTRQVRSLGGSRYDRDMSSGERIEDLGKASGRETVGALAGAYEGAPPDGMFSTAPLVALKVLRNLRSYGAELIQRGGCFYAALLAIAALALVADYFRTGRRDELFSRIWVWVWMLQLWGLYALVTPYMVDDRYMYPVIFPELMIGGFGVSAASAWVVDRLDPGHGPAAWARRPARWFGPVTVATVVCFLGLLATYRGLNVSPTLLMALLLAGAGAALGHGLDQVARAGHLRSAAMILAPVSVVAYILAIPSTIHFQTDNYIMGALTGGLDLGRNGAPFLVIKKTNLAFYGHAIGVVALFLLAAVPFLGRFSAGDETKGEKGGAKVSDAGLGKSSVWIGLAVLVGLAVLFLATAHLDLYSLFDIGAKGPSPAKRVLILGLLGMGAGLALANWLRSRLGSRPESRARLLALLIVGFTVSAFCAHLCDYLMVRDRSVAVSNKYSSGHREVAYALKARGLIQPGKVVASRKPFAAYYMDCQWYQSGGESIPLDVAGLEDLIKTGKIDYIVADSFTFATLRKRLMSVALGIRPVKGAHLIYSKYFQDYRRVITVYAMGDPPVAAPTQLQHHLEAARKYLETDNDFPAALKEADTALTLDPANLMAWKIKLNIYLIYYGLAYREDVPTLAFAPELLPKMYEAAEWNYRLAPNDPEAKFYYDTAVKAKNQESQLIKKAMETYKGQIPAEKEAE